MVFAMRLLLPFLIFLAPIYAADPIREDFRELPAHIPATSDDLSSDQLILRRLGPGADQLKLSFHPNKKNDPHYLWNGRCPGPVLICFDLKVTRDMRQSQVRLRSKNAGKSRLHLAVRTAQGWFAESAGIAADTDWTEHSIDIASLKWLVLDPGSVQLAGSATPNLGEVLSIGFAAPSKPIASKDCVRLDWFELRDND